MTTTQMGDTAYRLELNNGRHTFYADEPQQYGGADTAPAPDELLEAALASCTAITLRMYINRKGWNIPVIHVAVHLERRQDRTVINRSLRFEGEVDAQQRERLLQIAKACPVSKTLSGTIEMNSSVEA